jgi:hypothetical protein
LEISSSTGMTTGPPRGPWANPFTSFRFPVSPSLMLVAFYGHVN